MQEFLRTLDTVALYVSADTAVYFLCGVIILLAVWVSILEWRIHKILIGPGSHNLGDSIKHNAENIQKLINFKKEIEHYLRSVEGRLKKSVRDVEIKRFSPFGSGEGGDQSFATSFLNEDGDGVILSSLYSRDRVSVFAKPVKNFTSPHRLSNEEDEVLSTSKKKIEESSR